MKPVRARPRLVAHLAVSVNYVETVWPTCVSPLGSIVKRIDNRRKFDSKFRHTKLSQLAPLVEVLWTRKYDLVIEVVGILPDVASVCFVNIHHVKGHLLLVLFVQLIESGNLPPKRWSRITAEHQHNWFLAPQGGQLEMTLVISAFKGEIGCCIAHVKVTTAGRHP